MLNMNVYEKTELFKYGFSFNLLDVALNRYANGCYRGIVALATLDSSGTGHWPFSMFGLQLITGRLWAFQVTVLGLTFGTRISNSYNEHGEIGISKRQWYFLFSCLNHKEKNLEEII